MYTNLQFIPLFIFRNPFIYPSINLSIYQSFYLQSIYLAQSNLSKLNCIYQSIYISIQLSIYHLSIYSSIYIFIDLSIYLGQLNLSIPTCNYFETTHKIYKYFCTHKYSIKFKYLQLLSCEFEPPFLFVISLYSF